MVDIERFWVVRCTRTVAFVLCCTPAVKAVLLSSSLKESILPYLDAKDADLAQELDDTFPDEILLSHAAGTWKAAAAFKREHRES